MNKKIIFIARVVLIMIIAINIFNSISFADSNLKVVNDSALTSKSYVNARSAYLETIKLYASASINTEYALVDINKDGITVFTKSLTGIDGEEGLKGAIAEGIQYYIQAYEYAKNNEDIKNKLLDSLFKINPHIQDIIAI